MNKLETIESNVYSILRNYPETRSNDHLLYVKYIEEVHKSPFDRDSFIRFQQGFEGISRARRRNQEKHPELIDKATQKHRKEMQEEFNTYYGK